MALLVTVISAVLNGRSYPLPDRLVGGVLVGLFWAALTAVIIGSWKYFKRTPSSFSFFGATGFTGLFSVNTWKRISAEEAKKHPLYGVRGWLVFFAFSTLIGFAKDLTDVNEVALKAGVSLGTLLSVDMPEASFVKLVLWIHGLIVVPIYGLLFSKHPSFRPASIYLLLGFWPAVALAGFLNPFPALGELLVFSFILWAVSCAVWVTYLQKSKRVRVTFEHSVKAGLDNVAGTSHLPSDPRPAVTREPALERQFSDDSSERRMQATPAGTSKAMSPTQPTANPIAPVSIPAELSQNTIEAHEERFYEQIAQELDTNTVDKGLWTKAYAQAGGDDQQTRVLYIKARLVRLIAMQDS